MAFDREHMKTRAAALAAKGVFIGTSSWKYEGWLVQLYTPARYAYRGKMATTRFERGCLAEYAEVFKTVCVDAAFYKFPDEKYLTGLVSQVPESFLSKILQALCRAGLITSRRGQSGGFEILSAGRKASMRAVIEAIDGPIYLNICVITGGACGIPIAKV